MRTLLALLSLSGLLPGQGFPVRAPGGVPPTPPPATPAYKPEELCSVAGTVVHSVSGEPIRKANLMLIRIEPRADSGPPATTTSDAEGKFAMNNIEPGQFRISVSKAGFVGSESIRGTGNQAPTLTLEKGQAMKGVALKLSPQAVITGRITDDENDPVMHARVALVRYRYFQGKKQLMPSTMASTNDLGEYRLFGVAPGKYYLSVESSQMGFSYGFDRSAVRGAEETPVATYYPNASDIPSAMAINVPMGGAVQGIDVRMRKEKAFRVRGKVAGGASAGRGGMVMLLRKESGASDMMVMNRNMAAWRSPSGEFEIKGVRPGSYLVRAHFFEPPDQQMAGTAPVEVTNQDVEDITVLLTPGIEVSGNIRAEGDQPPKLDGVSIFLEGRNSRFSPMGSSMGRVKEDGSFQVAKLSTDLYDVRVNGVPPEYFIRSIRMADTDVRENGLNITGGGASGIEIVLSPKAAQLEGSVADAKGNPLRGASVVLRPKSAKSWELAAMRGITSDQNGRFKVQGLTPGEYHLIAFEGVDSAEAMDPDFFKDYETKAETVKLAESAAETRSLKAVTVPQQ